MSANKIIFDTVRGWLDAEGFTVDRIRELDAACVRFAQAVQSPPFSDRPTMVSPHGRELMIEHEGYAKKLPDGGVKAYPDPGSGGDPWTIGFGSTGPDIGPGTVWTRQQAEERFAADLIKFTTRVLALIGNAPTTQGQLDAMVSLAYNVGLGNFKESTLLRLHKEGDYAGAKGQFERWNKASGKILPGLVRRRAAEAVLYGGTS